MEEASPLKICRACLAEEGEMQSVFVSDEKTGTNIHLAEMIMAYASVQITLGDGLPEHICLSCAEKVSQTYVFKQLCEQSDTVLRAKFGKSPIQKEYASPILKLGTPTIIVEQSEDSANQDAINIVIKPEFDLDTEEDDEYYSNDNDIGITEEYLQDDSEDSDYEPLPSGYKCEICKKTFRKGTTFNRHKATHKIKYICEACNKSFNSEEDLLKHTDECIPDTVKQETEEIEEIKLEELDESLECDESGLYTCTLCPKRFDKQEDLSMHMRGHLKNKNKDKVLVCHVCSKKFVKNSHLTRHLKIHATIKAHVCTICNKGFARSEQLMNHMNHHSGIKPHVCQLCSKGFNQISNLKDHMRTHNGEKPFLCSICGKGFNQLGNLRQHMIRHSGIKAHLCSICGNGFASKGELGAHLRKHTGARPFVCTICNHGFTTSSSLTKHKRIHSGEKPYECEVCKMKFSRSGILARHKRTHTGEKPYVCKFCTKAFSQSNDLQSHLRIHTGEKPYICDCCGQAFRQSSALKTHKKTHMDRSAIAMLQTSILGDARGTLISTSNHTTLLNTIQ